MSNMRLVGRSLGMKHIWNYTAGNIVRIADVDFDVHLIGFEQQCLIFLAVSKAGLRNSMDFAVILLNVSRRNVYLFAYLSHLVARCSMT